MSIKILNTNIVMLPKFDRIVSMLFLVCQISYSASEYASARTRPPCESQDKNVLIEQFFNTVFTEFYSSPPVCVCVQMCLGQSTYCYPNGCLKSATHEDNVAKTETTPNPIMAKNNNFMLLRSERDFMTEFLEKNYVDEAKDFSDRHAPIVNTHSDIFKKKYNIIGKYTGLPHANLRQNIHYDKVKKDGIKVEGVDWNKTRWPMYARGSQRTFPNMEKPLKTQGNFFAAMLRDNEVAEYPPKYFKRELTKSVDDDEGNIAFIHLENSLDLVNGKNFSLETLIDNLIKSNIESTTNIANTKKDDSETVTEVATDNIHSVNSTGSANYTTNVILLNSTNENVEKNKYLDTSQVQSATNLSKMIELLSSRIEMENNTSMEIARKTIKNFDDVLASTEEEPIQTTNLTVKTPEIIPNTNGVIVEQNIIADNTTTTDLKFVTTTEHVVKVTKKNRQKIVKKASSKMNYSDLSSKF